MSSVPTRHMTSLPHGCRLACAVAALLLAACSHGSAPRSRGRTCLVLSVGGTAGMAHAGAIDALVESGVQFDCVYGNSAGALVGGVFAHRPDEPVTPRVRRVLWRNVRQTEADYQSNVGLGALIGLAFGPIGALVGAGAGYSGTDRVSLERATGILDEQLGHADISGLPIDFATSHLVQNGEGVDTVIVRTGNLR
jgi:hypothetical protein